jgi:hypothetical protein
LTGGGGSGGAFGTSAGGRGGKSLKIDCAKAGVASSAATTSKQAVSEVRAI